MTVTVDPGLARRRVRTALKRIRTDQERTQSDVAAALDWSTSKLIRIENGNNGISVTDLRALLSYYGITDASLVEPLIAAARAGRGRPWYFDEFHDLIRPQYAELLNHENVASSLRVFHPTVLPALLQTPEYAFGLKATVPDPDVRRRLVDLLMRRQQMLREHTGLDARFLIDEFALCRRIGSRATMAAQLDRLAEIAAEARFAFRILHDAGAHRGLAGPFVLLGFPDEDEDVAYFEGSGERSDTVFREDPETNAEYQAIFDELWERALSGTAALALIERRRREFGGDEEDGRY